MLVAVGPSMKSGGKGLSWLKIKVKDYRNSKSMSRIIFFTFGLWHAKKNSKISISNLKSNIDLYEVNGYDNAGVCDNDT